MILELYLALFALAGVCTIAYTVLESTVGGMSLVGGALWALLAVAGGEITIFHQDGTSTAVAEPAFQLVALALAVVSFGTFLLWFFGEYPPSQNDEATDAAMSHSSDSPANPFLRGR